MCLCMLCVLYICVYGGYTKGDDSREFIDMTYELSPSLVLKNKTKNNKSLKDSNTDADPDTPNNPNNPSNPNKKDTNTTSKLPWYKRMKTNSGLKSYLPSSLKLKLNENKNNENNFIEVNHPLPLSFIYTIIYTYIHAFTPSDMRYILVV